jgi:hypothetical protein
MVNSIIFIQQNQLISQAKADDALRAGVSYEQDAAL